VGSLEGHWKGNGKHQSLTRIAIRDTILKLIASANLEYKELTAKVQDAA
jgi:uncharacterized lipoprotein YehR (DUF1307 family)